MLRPDSKQCASAERIELSAGGEWHISRLSSSSPSPSSRTGKFVLLPWGNLRGNASRIRQDQEVDGQIMHRRQLSGGGSSSNDNK